MYCKLRNPIDHQSMSPHPKISYSTESFACRIYNLHIEIIKQIKVRNE